MRWLNLSRKILFTVFFHTDSDDLSVPPTASKPRISFQHLKSTPVWMNRNQTPRSFSLKCKFSFLRAALKTPHAAVLWSLCSASTSCTHILTTRLLLCYNASKASSVSLLHLFPLQREETSAELRGLDRFDQHMQCSFYFLQFWLDGSRAARASVLLLSLETLSL